jgi:hypothetical protein
MSLVARVALTGIRKVHAIQCFASTGVKAAINDNREGGRPGVVFMNDASPRNVCKGGKRHVESPYNYLRRTSAFSPLNL